MKGNRATIQEMWVRMKFMQMAKMQAYSFCSKKFKAVGVRQLL